MLGSLKRNAKLVLQDGSVFSGYSFGAETSSAGEVVFNTGMVGYPESLTDPSYKGQILALTYPLIGNYGIPGNEKEHGLLKNFESDRIQVSGLVISDYSDEYSHWNAKKSLGEWLKEHNIPGICGIDTRELTKKLRVHGVMLGKIIYEDKNVDFFDPNAINIAAEVSCKKPVKYGKGKTRILVVDTGCKYNIIRQFIMRGVEVLRVPWNYNYLNDKFDGLFISNGPGDPKQCKETIEILRMALEKEIPAFGICLGSQLMALASGGDTYKLKFGHRSQNQPCIEVGTKRCYITTQNHGFAVNMKTMPKGWVEWFKNLNDGTNEGIRHKTKPFMAVQFHPENYPGPKDTEFLFDRFIEMVKRK